MTDTSHRHTHTHTHGWHRGTKMFHVVRLLTSSVEWQTVGSRMFSFQSHRKRKRKRTLVHLYSFGFLAFKRWRQSKNGEKSYSFPSLKHD